MLKIQTIKFQLHNTQQRRKIMEITLKIKPSSALEATLAIVEIIVTIIIQIVSRKVKTLFLMITKKILIMLT